MFNDAFRVSGVRVEVPRRLHEDAPGDGNDKGQGESNHPLEQAELTVTSCLVLVDLCLQSGNVRLCRQLIDQFRSDGIGLRFRLVRWHASILELARVPQSVYRCCRHEPILS